MKRSNLIVQFGRIAQRLTFILRPLEGLLSMAIKPDNSTPIIVLLAPPRSGSTLTYQILTSGIRSMYLSNLSNLFYTTPILGNWLTGLQIEKKKSDYSSQLGFVPGLFGEAEGLKYWDYWIGQDLKEKNNLAPDFNKIDRLKKAIYKVRPKNIPFIFGYLGHVFCCEYLYKLTNNNQIVFIHLKRDLLSNAHSLYKASPDRMMSAMPLESQHNSTGDIYKDIVGQIKEIHRRIEDKTDANDRITLRYEELCQRPHETLYKLKKELAEKNIHIELRLDRVPQTFSYNVVDPDVNQNAKAFNKYLNNYKADI